MNKKFTAMFDISSMFLELSNVYTGQVGNTLSMALSWWQYTTTDQLNSLLLWYDWKHYSDRLYIKYVVMQ